MEMVAKAGGGWLLVALALASCSLTVATSPAGGKGAASSPKPTDSPVAQVTTAPSHEPVLGECPPGMKPSANGAVTVSVTDPAGHPLAKRAVTVAPVGARYQLACAPPAPAFQRAAGATDANGQFKATFMAPGDYTVADDETGTSAKVTIEDGKTATVTLKLDPAKVPPHASLTPRPDSVPFKRLLLADGPGPAGAGDVAWIDAADAFAAALGTSASPPAIDFTKDHVLAARVLGDACQGTDVVGVRGGESLQVDIRPYDDGCVNVAPARLMWAYLQISRAEPTLQGVPLPTPTPSATASR